MVAAKIYLSGGPCDGRTVSSNQIVGGLVAYIACGGGYYTADPAGKKHNGDLIFDYAGKTKPGPPSPGTLHAPQATRGWDDVRRGFHRKLPQTLHDSNRYIAAARRSLARAHKVGF